MPLASFHTYVLVLALLSSICSLVCEKYSTTNFHKHDLLNNDINTFKFYIFLLASWMYVCKMLRFWGMHILKINISKHWFDEAVWNPQTHIWPSRYVHIIVWKRMSLWHTVHPCSKESNWGASAEERKTWKPHAEEVCKVWNKTLISRSRDGLYHSQWHTLHSGDVLHDKSF